MCCSSAAATPAARRGSSAPTAGKPMLIVTETRERSSHGSMINFVVVDDKVRFDVALPPAERDQLRISSRLLAVARKVVPRS